MNRFPETIVGARIERRFMLPVSNDTLLRVVRRRSVTPSDPLIVVGIDDWAFRRNHRYGTIVCDLQRRRIVALLPNRETATVQAWLCGHPGIEIVSRDRGGGYGEAVTRAIPDAIQVADRWHLMENASAAFLDAVRRSMRGIRTAIGATTINPVLLTSAERLRYQGYLLRQEAYGTIAALVSNNVALKEIARRTGRSRNFVRQISRGAGTDVFRTRQSTLDIYLPFLEAHWTRGCHNGAELWRRLKGQGFEGSLSVVTGWATRGRRAEQVSDQQLRKIPAARSIARLMTTKRDHLTTAETVTVAAIEQGVPMLAKARVLVDRFQTMIRKKAEIELEPWINESRQSLIASFATGIAKDKAAVHAAIIQPWSNGQVEAQITKLKLVKRQMYGRAKLDLLQARLIGAP